MAVKRGKSQARRNSGSSSPLPGWAWMIIGVLLTIVVVMAAPRLLKPGGEPGFFRPTPNPDARPAAASPDAGDSVADDAPAPARPAARGTPAPAKDAATPETHYDFYTLLPGQEVAMTDAELAASARAEQERQRELLARERAAQQDERSADAADLADAPTRPTPPAQQPAPVRPAQDTATAATDGARYILQAGSFASNGDAESLKARIAMLGLVARVEQAEIEGRTMYRVRMGPYGTASELAEAKQKLGNGGLEALAIRAR